MPVRSGPLQALENLFHKGKELSPRARQSILSHGLAAVEPLLALAGDARLHETEDERLFYVQDHAVRLLGELGAVEAVEPLLHLYITRELDRRVGTLIEALMDCLPTFAEHLVEPSLSAYRSATHPTARARLGFVLAESGVQDERIFQLLLGRLAEDRYCAPRDLVAYGDPRAILPLCAMLDDYVAARTWPRSEAMVLLDLADSIEALGGTLTPAQHRAVALAGQLHPLQLARTAATKSILGEN